MVDEVKKNLIMKEIELKTEKKYNKDVLQSILYESSNEFKEKMGRNMSYGEMREMYG